MPVRKNNYVLLVLCFCDGHEQFEQFLAVGVETVKGVSGKVAAFVEELEPVFCLTRFLQGEVQLCVEIRPALTANGLLHIGANTRPASQDLFGKHKFMLLRAKVLIESNDAQGKCLALIRDNIISLHGRPLYLT